MKIFIDTANTDEIREAASWGVLSGVTTNPSLIAKEGKEFKSVVKEITEIADASPSNIASISAEVLSDDAEGMIAEAHELVKIHDVITIKVPMTEEGIKVLDIENKTDKLLIIGSGTPIDGGYKSGRRQKDKKEKRTKKE